MYERSAIVLERYFENLLGYREEGNIRDNFNNYCKLVEKLEKYQVNFQKELEATEEFRASVNKIKAIQAAQEKLYEKSVELEYNRNLLFGNVEGKVEDTKRCIEKIEEDVDKNNEAMKAQKEELIIALNEYNEKRFELSKCKRYKKMAENDYNEILEISQNNFEGITNEALKNAKSFIGFEDVDDIVNALDQNGKDEKIPFNEEVIQNATNFGTEIAKKEVAGYLVIYEKMSKLLSDIKDGTTKIELHKKYLRNEKAKMDFIMAVKDYMVQFLDYERMTIIYGRKSHNRLMSEACESFGLDVAQINNLYELLLMEVANKATKKAYKALYNKSYLIEIQDKEEKFKKEKSRVNLNTATLINSNYWRIDGITNIYTIFYKNVFEVFGREVEEFDIPQEATDAEENEELFEDQEDSEDTSVVTRIPFEITTKKVQNANTDEENNENEEDEEEGYSDFGDYNEIIDGVVNNLQDGNDDNFDIFGEKYKEDDFKENIVLKETIAAKKAEIEIDNSIPKTTSEIYGMKFELEDNEEEIPFEEIKEESEDTLFAEIKPIKSKRNGRSRIEDVAVTNDEITASKFLKKLKKVGGRKKSTESDIW